MAEHLLEAFELDIQVRLKGLEPINQHGYKVEATEIEPGEIYRDENVWVTSFEGPHGSWKPAFDSTAGS